MQRPNNGEHLPVPNPGHGVPAPPGFPVPAGYVPNPFAVASPTAPAAVGGRSLPTIAELVHAFKRRWVLALMVGGLMAVVLAAAVWMALPSGKHRVQAIVRFRSIDPSPVMAQGAMGDTEFERYMENHKEYIQTKGFLGRVASQNEIGRQPLLAQAEDKAAAIKGMISVKRDPSEYLTLTMNGDEPKELQTILNAVVTAYKDDVEDKETRARKSLLVQITDMLTRLNKQIEDRRQAMKAITEKAPVGGDPTVPLMLKDMELKQAADSRIRLSEEVQTLEVEVQQLGERVKAGEFQPDPLLTAELIEKSESVQQKRAVLAKAEADYEAGQKRFNPENPLLKEWREARDKARTALDDEVKRVTGANGEALKEKQRSLVADRLQAKTDELKLKKGVLAATVQLSKKLEEERQRMAVGGVQYNQEKDDIDPLIEQRNKFVVQREELMLSEKNATSRMEVVEDATIYPNFNLKQKIAFAVVAAVLGLLGVTLVLAYLEWRNRRVDGVDQVVTDLGMRVIGTIPAFPSRNALRNGDATANQNWRFILNESVNSTRTMLLHAAKTQQMQVLLVTSAMQGEGKTSLSSQLATSMATAGLRTLILDCDLRNPSMQKLFDIPVAPGCAEILLQEIDISDAVQPTSVPNLWIIPAGQCNHRVIAALAQGHPLEALFQRLRGQFDIVVVDSCPILPVADTLLVAQHVDGVVFSILQDVSQLPKVQDASDRLVQLNIPLLGAVVNGIKPDVQAYGYNYVKQLPA